MSDQSLSAAINELKQRTRRIETRLVAGLEALGVSSASAQKCEWRDPCVVIIPSRDVRLADMMSAIPPNWTWMRDVDVMLGDDVVAVLTYPKQLER